MSRSWLGKTAGVTMPLGEVADRLAIAMLKIVRARPTGDKLSYQLHDVDQYSHEWMLALDQLKDTERKNALASFEKLSDANYRLWDAEDAVRLAREGSSDAAVLKIAVTIAATNDERAKYKQEINTAFGQSGDLKSYRKENDAPAKPDAPRSDA